MDIKRRVTLAFIVNFALISTHALADEQVSSNVKAILEAFVGKWAGLAIDKDIFEVRL